MLRASVPEATVNEDGKFGSREDDIGMDRPVLRGEPNWVVDSKAEAQGKEC
jgi:hypothetical protein